MFGAIAGALGAASFLSGERTNRANVSTAREQMEFQKEMSNTSHQRQVTDLKAAGLNPLLSSKYGGASTPGGARAEIKDSGSAAITTGLQAALLKAQTANVQADTKLKGDQSAASVPYGVPGKLTKLLDGILTDDNISTAKEVISSGIKKFPIGADNTRPQKNPIPTTTAPSGKTRYGTTDIIDPDGGRNIKMHKGPSTKHPGKLVYSINGLDWYEENQILKRFLQLRKTRR